MSQVDTHNLRQHIKAQRLALSEQQRNDSANRIQTHLCQSELFQSAEHIGCYYAVSGEVPTQGIIDAILTQHKRCYLPCLTNNKHQPLVFREYQHHTTLVNNRYQIPEPPRVANTPSALSELHLVLVPLVAFDNRGHRLGMGGGYYDRSFSCNKTNVKPVPLIGLAYDFQYQENFDVNVWDIPLLGVVSESGMRIYSPNT